MKKNIILHDTFLYKWGWERLILMMAKALDADLASGFFSKWSFDLRKEWFKWEMISLTDEVFKKWFRHFKLKFAFLFKTKFLKNYENVIFSGDSISAVRNCWKNTKKSLLLSYSTKISLWFEKYLSKKSSIFVEACIFACFLYF